MMIKKELKSNYEKACNAYLLELANMWDWNCKSYGYWIGDAIGGVYAYDDNTTIGMDDIIFCVENDVEQSEYNKFVEYYLWAKEFGFATPNFPSYYKGCPIVNIECRTKITKLKEELERTIAETKTLF